MATTNFLQWNPTQANQESDAAYLADSQRSGGAVDNTPLPATLGNKGFYQWSTFIAAFCQMLADKGYSTSDVSITALKGVLANILTQDDGVSPIASVAFSPTPAFDASAANGFQMTLTGNVTGATISGVTPGQLLAFYFVQDAIGGRTVAWPGSFAGAAQPDPAPNAISLMLFRASLDGVARPAGPMMSSNGMFLAGTAALGALTLLSGAPIGSMLFGNGTTFVAKQLTGNDVTATRSYGLTYQNTSIAEMEICVTGEIGSGGGAMTAFIGSGGPTQEVMSQSRVPAASSNPIERVGLTFKVPSQWYYSVATFNLVLQRWYEYSYA
jgi:hypothetical protein